MKKSLLSLVVGFSCALSSNFAFAEDLIQVYEIGTANDTSVLRAKAQADAQKYAQDQAFASLLPSLGLSLQYSSGDGEAVTGSDGTGYMVSEGWSNGLTRTLTLEQSIFNLADWENLGIAEKRSLQSLTQYEQAKQDLIVRIADGYFDVLGALDGLEFVQAEKRAIERQLEQTKQRYAVGLTAITDVHEAQAQYDQSVANEIVAKNTVETARETLRTITGKYHSDISPLNIERFSTVKPNKASTDLVNIAKDKNLALQVAKSAVDIAQDQIELAKTGHYPTLSFSASYSDSLDNAPGKKFEPRTDGTSAGLTLRVPLYNGGAVVAASDQARALYIAASEDLESSMRNTTRSVITSYNQVVSDVARYNALKQAEVSAESALQATEAGFEVGTRTIVDVLVSTRNLYNAKRNLADLRYQYIMSTLRLKQATGTLSRADLEAINRGLDNA